MFSDYEALKIKTLVFKLRNKDSVSRRVKIMQPETNLFKICPFSEALRSETERFLDVGNKVAPGLEISFLIRFSPETKNDYSHDLVIVTEREKFIVPIFAIGKKALLDFPDSVNFGSECPVKYLSEKSVILHNRGDKATKWELKLPDFFSASRTEGLIEENATEQILLRFFPLKNKAYEETGRLFYDGDEATFSLRGNAINGEVFLSRGSIKIEETYISLESKQTFKIVNKSTVKIDFEWRAFSSEKEETDKRRLLSEQLTQEEAEKKKIINEMIDLEENIDELHEFGNGREDNEADGSFDDASISEREAFLKKRKKAEMLLERKYKAIRKALEEDTFVFEDEIFSIQPIRGCIWPNSEMVITVIFKPKSALRYTHKAYCNVSCSDERLLLMLEGEGLGPKAFLSTNILSIGDIFVNDKQSFNLYIENKGEIPAHFSLVKNGPTSTNIITFDSEEGMLAVGQRMNIILTFQSFRVGEFQEMFKWKLDGSSELLTLLVRGHVRSPRFEFDKKIIDFKRVSYQFEEIQDLVLTNTSSVMFTFSLRIPQDGKGSNREFEIIPSTDSIAPGEAKKIQIKFIPHFRKSYNLVLVLDMEGIGKDMKTIPIVAEADVPKVRLAVDTLDFGDIFLRYPQTKTIELINESKLHARFVIHPINPKFAAFGKVTTDLDKGQIPPESSVHLNVGLTTCCLKNFQIDLVLEIVSDSNEQHLIKIKGNSIGPIVELSAKEIDFGEQVVLQKHVKKVTITNKSIIEADFYAFTKNKNSVFKPVQRHYVLKAGQSFDVDIVCVPDDNQKFMDTLFFVIKEGVDKEVKLKAKGIGSTIFCKDISTVDFGVMYTHRTQMQEVFIENKGRKTQTLKWTRKVEGRPKGEEKPSATPGSPSNASPEDSFVFSVYPETIVLPAKTGLMFQFKAHSTEVGRIREQFVLSSSINTERKTNPLFTSTFEAEFIRPQLVFNKKALNFQYVWEKDTSANIISQDLEITCGSPLAANFSLYVEPPFTVFPDNVSLLPGKKAVVRIDFDPTLKKDRVSGQISDKIWIKHYKHPKNESFPITAEFCYPNLAISTDEINFGAVMNDTIKKYSLTMRNTSLMPLSYCWFFADQVESEPGVGQTTVNIPDVPLNEVFDILPLRGTIDPEGEESVEFLYFALSNRRFQVTAVCKVDGGPDYFINVSAEASSVAYSISLPKRNKSIDIGETYLGTKVVHEFEIENTSKVMFDYSLHMDLSYPKAKLMVDFISFMPSKGVLSGGEKAKVRLFISPGFPGELSQCLILQIAHFEPERIHLKGYGLFPSLRLDARRRIDSDLIRTIQKLQLTEGQTRADLMMGQPMTDAADPLNASDQLGSDSRSEPFANQFEALFFEMPNEAVVDVERVLIKQFIKANRARIAGDEKKSVVSGQVRSQTKIPSSTQVLGKDESQVKVKTYKNDLKIFEEIVLGSYIMNLGTIIAGNKSSKTLKVCNIGKCVVNFAIDMKGYKSAGLSISTTKVHKLPFSGANSCISLQVSLQTKKTTRPGRQVFHVAINVENGGRYILEIVAFVTVPELAISSDKVDFGPVQIGISKKIFLKLENTKEINCDWSATSVVLNQRQTSKKEEQLVSKISIMPNHGTIVSGGKKLIELCFDPNEHRVYEEMISFSFKDSTRKLDVHCRGEGIQPVLEFVPPSLVFPPCMPKTTAFRSFLVKNNSDFEICLVANDRDAEVLEDEKLLAELPAASLRTRIRKMGEPFWPDLKEDIELVRVRKGLEAQIAELEASKPDDWVAKVAELQAVIREKSKKKTLLPQIAFEKQENLIILSHWKDIDKLLAEFLQEAHLKAIINVADVLEWNVRKGTEAGAQASGWLQAARADYEAKETERRKQRGRKPAELEPLPSTDLPQDMFEALLRCRLADPDCNVGCIFHDLANDLTSQKITVESILTVLNGSKTLVVEVCPTMPTAAPNATHYSGSSRHSSEAMESSHVSNPKPDTTQQGLLDFINERVSELRMSEEQRAMIINSLEQKDSFEIDPANTADAVRQLILMSQAQVTHHEFGFTDNLTALEYGVLKQLPKPCFPDPNVQPLPEPQEFQVLRKCAASRRLKTFKNFKMLTPREEFDDELTNEELTVANAGRLLNATDTKWILKPKSSRQFFIQFSSDFLGDFSDSFTFENFLTVFNNLQRPLNFPVKAVTEYPSISRTLANIFPLRRKNRPKVGSVVNEFILSENLFEFGPLMLLSKGQSSKAFIQKRHSTQFRFTNVCNYPITLTLMLQSEIGDFTACPALASTPGVFEIEQREVTIGTDPFEARVWCFPKATGVFTDSIICVVKHNPVPYKINMRCSGIMPSVAVSPADIVFERILVDKRTNSTFDIRNDSLIPVRWRISNFADLQKQGFEISKEFMELEVDQKVTLDISFTTKVQEKKACQIQIEAEDTQGLGIRMRDRKVINLTAEGFKVNVGFTGFKTSDKMLIDFGSTLVDFPIENAVGIRNEGIYPIRYQLEVTKPSLSQYFEISPATGELAPNALANIQVRFTAKKEVCFDEKTKDSCLLVKIFERSDVFNQVPVFVKANSQFARVAIEPCKTLSFGPVAFYETKVKTFEVTNCGSFELAYELFEFDNQGAQAEVRKRFEGMKAEQQAARAKAKDKGITVPKAQKGKTDKLVTSQFTVSPIVGNLLPGQTQKFEVVFKGQGAAFYESRIGFEHTNRNPQDTGCTQYILSAESCVPCLETQNFRVIFEEQVVTQSLTSTGINIQSVVNTNIFSIEDNAFYFGNIVPTQNPEGITERIKIINNGKVFANVKFDVLKKNQALFAYDVNPKQAKINPHESVFVKISFKPEIMAQYEGVFQAVVENGDSTFPNCKLVFDLKGEGTLPSLSLMPDGLSPAGAGGELVLDLGKVRLGKTKKSFICIKNIGIIPASFQSFFTVSSPIFRLVSPPERTLMPLEVYQFNIEFCPQTTGKFDARLAFSTMMNPYEKSTVLLKAECIDEICIFEDFEGEDNIIDFGDIVAMPVKKPEASSEDRGVKYGKKKFMIKNYSNETLRVDISRPDDLLFIEVKPQRSHIPPKMSRKVIVSMYNPSGYNITELGRDLVAKCTLISLKNRNSLIQKLANWDSSKTSKRMISQVEQTWLTQVDEMRAKFLEDKVKNPKTKEPVYPPCPSVPSSAPLVIEYKEPIPEPEFETLPGFNYETKVRVCARIDVPKITLDTNHVVFKATKMYSSRVFTFKISNNSSINIPYSCEFFNPRTSSKDSGPFSISPASGTLPKNSGSEFILRFAPTEFEANCQRVLTVKVGTGGLEELELTVQVEGEVTRPICHFELPYTISDQGEKLIEIDTLGINTKVTKKFHVINPTLLGYEFVWVASSAKSNGFRCVTPKGVILPGKKFEMVFEFAPEAGAPEKQDVQMSFKVAQFNLIESFVFRTKVMQPKVFFSTSKIDFGPLLLSGKSKEVVYIKNLDQSTYSFAFQKLGLKGTGAEHANSLKIQPLTGQLPPGQDTPITLSFSPKMETDFNYNLQVLIPQKREPLTLNVKGRGYKLHHEMRLAGCAIEPRQKHLVDFGEMFVHEYRKKTIDIVNSGDFNIDFVVSKKPHATVTLQPESGTVRKGEQVSIEVIFQTVYNLTLSSEFQIQIVSGPIYEFQVQGAAKSPLLELTPRSINFGELILKKSGVSKTVYIECTNVDKKTLAIESDFTKNEYLELKMPFGQTVQPFEDKKENILRLPLTFRPTVEGKFATTLNFFVNGRHKIEVAVKGEAINCLFELANPQDLLTDFGVAHVNTKQSRSIGLKNFSKLAMVLRFDIDDQLAKLASLGLTISPPSLTLQKRGVGSIEVTFSPTQRQRQFYLPVRCLVQDSGETSELLTLSGACFAPELKLIEDALNYGPVVVNSYLTKKAQLVNSGDLSADFAWELGQTSNYLAVSPLKGVIAPNEQLTFEITFSPKSLSDYKSALKLYVKGQETPFTVTITGKGIATPASSIEYVAFETNVRTKTAKTVMIKNPTPTPWNLRPTITTDVFEIKDYFSCLKAFDVPANGQTPLDITYHPLSILPEKQNALLFIPLSDGTALTFQLQGKPLPPKPEEPISLTLKAKTQVLQSILISNWLSINQKFAVSYKLANDKPPTSEGILINSVSVIEVAPGNAQNFKLSIYALKKGSFVLNILFQNKENKEHLHYIVNLTVEEPTVMKSFELFNFVRERKVQSIAIENPLPVPVTIQPEHFSIDSKDIFLSQKTPLVIKPQSEVCFDVIYRPLLTYKAQRSLIRIASPDLGNFVFEMVLNSEKSSNLPTINFKASLGTDHTRNYQITNYLMKPAGYTCKVERLTENDLVNNGPTDFVCETPTIQAPAATSMTGVEAAVNIKFEPSMIGVSKALLTISNPEGGEFQAYLIGLSSPPLPKGPFKISAKGSTIDFKNTFYEAKEFFIRIDNPNFACSTKSPFKLEPKKSILLSLTFKGAAENNTGRITIETKEQITWIYYLQGV